MTAAAKIIEQQIRDLPLEDMLTIHAQLVTSIHAKEDSAGLNAEFRSEIQRRIAEIESGTAKGFEAFEALKEM